MRPTFNKMTIKFGPASLGSVEDAEKNLEKFHELGFKACEIPFTYSVYIKEKDAIRIGKKAKQLGIQLSIHAPYFINLNSDEKVKIENSKKRIINCLKIGTLLDAKYVVFHPGFYGKNKEGAYENIKKQILELQEIRKKEKYTPKLAPETMGKINVFGSINEIAQLVTDTKCSACIDFAHILARYQGNYKFEETLKKFKNLKELHIHFSGIIYSDKGEKKHKPTEDNEIKELLKNLPKNKDIVVINESPNMINDTIKSIEIYRKLTV